MSSVKTSTLIAYREFETHQLSTYYRPQQPPKKNQEQTIRV